MGKRIKYVYSKTQVYEYIYLTSRLYMWHCIEDAEIGLADNSRRHGYKITGALYLFVWREKIIPISGVVIVDYKLMQITGNLFGNEGGDFAILRKAAIEAYATPVNVTNYP